MCLIFSLFFLGKYSENSLRNKIEERKKIEIINDISDELKQSINPEMEEYGITVANFFVTSIDAPEEDSAVKKLKDASYNVMPDRIEAGTLLCAAAGTRRKNKTKQSNTRTFNTSIT